MSYSSFKIIFSESDSSTGTFPPLGTIVSVLETSTSVNFKETLVTHRLATGEFSKPLFSGGNYIGYLADFLKQALNLDFNQDLKYLIEAFDFNAHFNGSGRGYCVVTALYPNAVFAVDPLNVLPSNIRLEITNIVSSAIIDIGTPVFSTASSTPCELVKVTIPTTPASFKVVSPIVNNSPTNPVVFDINRGQSIQFIVENPDGVKSNKQIQLPDYLSAANFTPNTIITPSGATVTIVGINNYGLTLQYSLNGTVWQSSNVFSGLTAGNYNFYVKDQFGCQFLRLFTVKEFSNNDINIPVPFLNVSKSNPIRYAQRVDFNLVRKTDDNTLSYESDSEPMYCEKQLWLNTDVVKTQFKSNYSDNIANVVKPDGSRIPIYPNKMSYNMDIKDKRDCRITSVVGDPSKTGIYFTTGNTYNYDTNAITGSYGLYGALPEWGLIGNYFKIGSAWHLIESTFYDTVKQATILVFTLNYVANPNPVIVSTIYDRFNYEVYEFDVDFSNYVNTDVQIEIASTDLNYITQKYLSEKQQVKYLLPELMLEIRYYNTGNTDIFYATGFKGLIRLPYQTIKPRVDEQTDLHKTDTNVFLLDAVLNEIDEIRFEPITKEMCRKLMRILAHEIVGINGIGYVTNSTPTIEQLGFSNICNIQADMIKTGDVYSAIVQSGDEISTAPPIDIPNLVITESGFISY